MASRVVVGFDGSEEARKALDWALQEAGIRNAPLRVVAAVQGVPPVELWGVPAPAKVSEEELAGARSRTESALAAALKSHPGVSAEVVAVPGHPSAVLIRGVPGRGTRRRGCHGGRRLLPDAARLGEHRGRGASRVPGHHLRTDRLPAHFTGSAGLRVGDRVRQHVSDPDFVEVVEQVGRVLRRRGRRRPVPARPGRSRPTAGRRRARARAGRPAGPRRCRRRRRSRDRSTPSRSAAARKRSGSGLAWRTWSRVTIGAPPGTPSISSVGRAVSSRPLVAIAQGPRARSACASSSRAPGQRPDLRAPR